MEKYNNIIKKELTSYLSKLNINETIKKEIEWLFDTEPETLYTYFPLIFIRDYISNGKGHQLALGGWFFYRSLMKFDKVVDGENFEPFDIILQNILHEEAIKLLTSIFPINHKFWNKWNTRRQEMLGSFEKQNNFNTIENEDDYINFSDGKSAFFKSGFDALYLLNHISLKEYEIMLNAAKFFSTGLQLIDDIQDIQEDFINKRYNHAVSRVVNTNDLNSYEIEKNIYINGVAKSLYLDSIKYFKKSKNIAKFKEWGLAMDNYIEDSQKCLGSIAIETKVAFIKSRLSYKKKDYILTKESNDIALKSTLNRAVSFILKEQTDKGYWEDNLVNGWFGEYWVTGWILFHLHGLLGRTKSILLKKSFDKAVEYLTSRKTNIWGYSPNWIEDADSTNFVVLGILPFINNKEKEEIINELLKFQSSQGGIHTYRNKKKLILSLDDPKVTDVTGWMREHSCVSSATYLLLSHFNSFKEEKKKLRNYLLNSVSESGLIIPYWWTSPIYNINLLTQANTMEKNTQLSIMLKAGIKNILEKQNVNGSFQDNFQKENSFYTGQSLITLTSNSETKKKYKNEISKAIEWLISNQNTDGSWDASTGLRIPSPEIEKPEFIKDWQFHDLGPNNVIVDFHRLISTATIIKGLTLYLD